MAARARVILDTSPLVTLCTARVANKPIIHKFLEHADIHLTDAVEQEVVLQYEKSDAQIAKSLIKSGQINVIPAPTEPTISDFYKLHETDCGVIRLGIALPHLLTIIDDKEAYVVSTRYGLHPMFLLDLFVLLVQQHGLEKQSALDMVKSAEKDGTGNYPVTQIRNIKVLEKSKG